MKKILKALKASPIAMIVAGVLIAGVASAALLSVYGNMLGTADVQQSVKFGNGDTEKTYTIGDSPAIAGNTYTQDYNLRNDSDTTAPIKFATQYKVTGVHGWWNSEEGVETSYWSTLDLSTKNTSNWTTTGIAGGTLTYNLVSNVFEYEFEAEGLNGGGDYSLIYYADRQDRFNNPGGDNPGALIAEFTADENGEISEQGTKNLGMDLPHPNDWNGTADADYCKKANGYDDYELCRGAKIWLVPSSDYNKNTKQVNWSNMNDYLYETDLITYDDVNNGEALHLGTGRLNFFVKTVFDVALQPGEYKVKTEVQPVY